MTKKYKIAVSSTVVFEVEGSYNDGEGKNISFKFSLTGKRLGAEELKDALGQGNTLIKKFLQERITNWSGQRLILDDDDTPAAFCAEAFEALLDIAGMGLLIFNTFVSEQGAKVKNS